MNEIFNFHGQKVRTLTIDDEPWFVGKDVADILGYSKARNAIALHVDEEDALKQGIPTSGGTQDMLIINESGLYSLILSSKLPQAKEFKRWVTSEVLPAIRKQGGFIREDLDEDAFFFSHSTDIVLVSFSHPPFKCGIIKIKRLEKKYVI